MSKQALELRISTPLPPSGTKQQTPSAFFSCSPLPYLIHFSTIQPLSSASPSFCLLMIRLTPTSLLPRPTSNFSPQLSGFFLQSRPLILLHALSSIPHFSLPSLPSFFHFLPLLSASPHITSSDFHSLPFLFLHMFPLFPTTSPSPPYCAPSGLPISGISPNDADKGYVGCVAYSRRGDGGAS